MEWDDDADDAAFRRPLPPEDRVWRHPSEIGLAGALAAPPHRVRPWALALAAGLAGAAAVTLVVAMTTGLGTRVVERQVVERVRVAPASIRGGTSEAAVVAAREVSPAVVRLDVRTADGTGTGSGVILRDDGYMVTNAHVIDGAEEISAVLADGRTYTVSVVGTDRVTDLAVLHVDATGLPPAPLGSATGLEVGEPAIAIGSPLGLAGGPSVTVGVVSALGRRIDPPSGEPLFGMIQTDAPIAPGSSGGALVDRRGAVVGLTSAIAMGDGGFEDLGFATPIEVVRIVTDDLIRSGAARHVWLGIAGHDLDPATAGELGVVGGVSIGQVVVDGPADTAGLEEADVIVAIDSEPVRSMPELMAALRLHRPGEHISLAVIGPDGRQAVPVTLGERPPVDAVP